MSDDLIIGDPDGEELDEYEIEDTGLLEYIQAAYFAISSIEDIDEMMLTTNESKKRVKRIRSKSLRIIDYCLNELHSNLFGEEES